MRCQLGAVTSHGAVMMPVGAYQVGQDPGVAGSDLAREVLWRSR
jgi:hypothetical protein